MAHIERPQAPKEPGGERIKNPEAPKEAPKTQRAEFPAIHDAPDSATADSAARAEGAKLFAAGQQDFEAKVSSLKKAA